MRLSLKEKKREKTFISLSSPCTCTSSRLISPRRFFTLQTNQTSPLAAAATTGESLRRRFIISNLALSLYLQQQPIFVSYFLLILAAGDSVSGKSLSEEEVRTIINPRTVGRRGSFSFEQKIGGTSFRSVLCR